MVVGRDGQGDYSLSSPSMPPSQMRVCLLSAIEAVPRRDSSTVPRGSCQPHWHIIALRIFSTASLPFGACCTDSTVSSSYHCLRHRPLSPPSGTSNCCPSRPVALPLHHQHPRILPFACADAAKDVAAHTTFYACHLSGWCSVSGAKPHDNQRNSPSTRLLARSTATERRANAVPDRPAAVLMPSYGDYPDPYDLSLIHI